MKSPLGDDSDVLQEEKFYATLNSSIDGGVIPDTIARNALIEFHKCHVGGSMNGIETGAKVVSRSPIELFECVD